MADQGIRELAQGGADSVYGYVERTAEMVTGGVRRQTKSYRNQMQYDPSVFDGVAGISLFLSDDSRMRGSTKAQKLARGALEWCSAPEQASPQTLERAADFARRILAYRRATPEGDSWASDVAGIDSPDFMCGASGAGHFSLGLEAVDRLRQPLA